MDNYQNPQCYASRLGDCSHQISKEHYFSDELMKLCGNGCLELAEFILCQNHNSSLSNLDESILKFANKINESNKKINSNEKIIIDVEGKKLERWLLKFFLGYWASGKFKYYHQIMSPNNIPLDLIKILYDKESIQSDIGLFYSENIQREVILKMQKMNLSCIIEFFGGKNNVGGIIFGIGSFVFILVIEKPNNLNQLDWEHHPKKLKSKNIISNIIYNINWR